MAIKTPTVLIERDGQTAMIRGLDDEEIANLAVAATAQGATVTVTALTDRGARKLAKRIDQDNSRVRAGRGRKVPARAGR